jgi:hypothetical protein
MVETLTANGETLPLVDMSGATDYAHKRSALTMRTQGKTILDIRQDAGVTYMSSAYVLLPNGAHWVAVRPSDLKLSQGQSPLGSSDPSSGLQYLSAIKGNPVVAGHDRIDGNDTTHYKFTIDIDGFLHRLAEGSKAALGSDAFGSSLEQLRGVVDLTKLPAEAWIDGDGRVRQFEFDLSASQGGQSVKVVAVLKFSHFDEPVSVSAPPASETMPFSQFPAFFSLLGSGVAASQQT